MNEYYIITIIYYYTLCYTYTYTYIYIYNYYILFITVCYFYVTFLNADWHLYGIAESQESQHFVTPDLPLFVGPCGSKN